MRNMSGYTAGYTREVRSGTPLPSRSLSHSSQQQQHQQQSFCTHTANHTTAHTTNHITHTRGELLPQFSHYSSPFMENYTGLGKSLSYDKQHFDRSQGLIDRSQDMTHSQFCKVSEKERNFANDRRNWNSDSDFDKIQEFLKKGDEAHKREEFKEEGENHRTVQEAIRKRGGVGSYDIDGKKAYSWNALYMHHSMFIDNMKTDGFSFDETFDYVNGRYYLKENAYNHAIKRGHDFDKIGRSSIVNPNMKKQGREIYRISDYDDDLLSVSKSTNSTFVDKQDYIQSFFENCNDRAFVTQASHKSIPTKCDFKSSSSSTSSTNYFPPFNTAESRAFCENIGRPSSQSSYRSSITGYSNFSVDDLFEMMDNARIH